MHPLVNQLHFARGEFLRCVDGVSGVDAVRRLGPMNCISWIVGHLASQEHYLWVISAQGQNLAPGLRELVGFGRPASTPPLDEMWHHWKTITQAADRYLLTLGDEDLTARHARDGLGEDVGTSLLRNTYHYWFHTGEAHAIRQMLGHRDLPQFVGSMTDVLYRLPL